jgi:SpoVK/Ycf46/Vps4 family AAA+-type ATPase
MGMDANMLACIRALAENRIQDAKKEAICCCLNDTTKKNESQTTYYKKLLENGSAKMLELPVNLQGLLYMQDMSDFNEKRYYLGNAQKELFSKIENGVNITTKMMEYGIPYMNSTLIFGIPGTGKTEFAKYVAYKLNLPYAYIKFSYLIDSYLGKTAQNLNRIFDYCKGQKCVLMLDEIDCIGLARSNDTGVDGELGRTTIALMQLLDELVEGQVIIAATNRSDRLDPALLRRFQRQIEFSPYDQVERKAMIERYINSVDSTFLTDEMLHYADHCHTQAETVKFLVEKIIEQIV